MKFVLYNWAHASSITDYFKSKGYEHNRVYDGNIFDYVTEFLDAGFNILIHHSSGEAQFILYVDTRQFTQR